MKINFTPEQQDAIRARGKDIIVSAAAGSGKTATLTERIIRRLCDENNPADISRMLIVTFTNAAASDMKRKISEALTRAVAQNPQNRHLRRQKMKLQSARISTIHSFFFDVVKANFERLGISPAARIADDEGKALAQQIMRREINKRVIIKNDNRVDDQIDNHFDNLCEIISDGYYEELPKKLVDIYNKLASFPDGIEFVKQSANRVQNLTYETFFSSDEGKEIINNVKSFFMHYKKIYADAINEVNENPKAVDKYLKSYETEYDFICQVLQIEDPNKLLEFISKHEEHYKLDFKKGGVGNKSEELVMFGEMRKKFRDEISRELQKGFGLNINFEEFPEYCRLTYSYLICLYDILKSFEKAFQSEKTKQGILDYADAERLCLKLLLDEDGNKTPAANELSLMFDEIYIDEYQDVNEIQEKIFCIISSDNRFMVGDVKQSIYGFRGSCPEIFSAYRKKFTAFNSETENSNVNGYKIFMSDNFRCDNGIIKFSNEIFKKLFPLSKYIDFCEEDNLKHGKANDDANEEVELAIFDRNYPNETEVGFIAKRIRTYLNCGRQPKEIAILVRSKKKLNELKTELEKYSVPVAIQKTENYFERSEILLLLSLLNCIDNPTREIWLAGALRSPIFGFTLDEIFEIKNYRKKDVSGVSDKVIDEDMNLFHNLCLYTEETKSNKGKHFLKWLSECRKKERELSVDKLVSYVIESCLIMQTVLKTDDAEERKQSVLRFMEMAYSFVSSGGTSLCNFMRRINELAKSGGQKEESDTLASMNKVRVMTIHNSKGQEFPICFLYNFGGKFNNDTPSYLIDSDLGMGIKLRSGGGLVKVETPLFKNVLIRTKEKSIDEEMRILYVALTRAREKLIITGSVGTISQKPFSSDKLIPQCRFASNYMTPYLLSKRSSFLEWLLICNPKKVSILVNGEAVNENDNLLQTDSVVKKEIDLSEVEEKISFICDRLSYKYPYSVASKLPAKVSVSELYPSLLDEINADAESLTNENEDKDILAKKPQFIIKEGEYSKTSAEKGVATHVFMQFCNFDNCIKNGIDFEIKRLVDNSFIPFSVSELIDTTAVEKFFNSKLFSKMTRAKRLKREARFNVKLPANEFTTDEGIKEQISSLNETIFVQGVIDCYFYDENDNLCIVDYKTDHFSNQMLVHPEKVKEILVQRHSLQLGYYKKALEIITKKQVSKVYLYSFALNDAIEMPV